MTWKEDHTKSYKVGDDTYTFTPLGGEEDRLYIVERNGQHIIIVPGPPSEQAALDIAKPFEVHAAYEAAANENKSAN